jgi:hypothetical protein
MLKSANISSPKRQYDFVIPGFVPIILSSSRYLGRFSSMHQSMVFMQIANMAASAEKKMT